MKRKFNKIAEPQAPIDEEEDFEYLTEVPSDADTEELEVPTDVETEELTDDTTEDGQDGILSIPNQQLRKRLEENRATILHLIRSSCVCVSPTKTHNQTEKKLETQLKKSF